MRIFEKGELYETTRQKAGESFCGTSDIDIHRKPAFDETRILQAVRDRHFDLRQNVERKEFPVGLVYQGSQANQNSAELFFRVSLLFAIQKTERNGSFGFACDRKYFRLTWPGRWSRARRRGRRVPDLRRTGLWRRGRTTPFF